MNYIWTETWLQRNLLLWYVDGFSFVPRCIRLQLEWFVIALSVELRNLHHPCYLDRHHRVVHFIWEHTQTQRHT